VGQTYLRDAAIGDQSQFDQLHYLARSVHGQVLGTQITIGVCLVSGGTETRSRWCLGYRPAIVSLKKLKMRRVAVLQYGMVLT